MIENVTKIDAARRQLDTAIDLYFHDADGLSVYTLAFASLKVLISLYPHHRDDGFDMQLDNLVGNEGWRSMSGVANFLKHADRDADAILTDFHPDRGMAVIGLASLLFRRLTGAFSIKMEALDCWVEMLHADEFGIPQVDQDVDRAAFSKRFRDALNQASREVRISYATQHYRHYLAHRDQVQAELTKAYAAGMTIQQILDEKYGDGL